MKFIRSSLIAGVLALCVTFNANAFCDDTDSWMDLMCQRMAKTWTEGDSDLYVPFHTYHIRSSYSKEKIDSFEEDTWGVGYGRSRYIDGNWDGWYGMGFRDSHGKFEPIVGYAHQWMWGAQDGLHAGLGYTVFITARSDIMHYTPFPGALPLASINYNKFSINTTYVPGGEGNGNIFFFWSRLNF
jgi:lipid IVA palmitoyltransferase